MTPLPPPVARFRDLALAGGVSPADTVAIETTAWMRRPGLPRIPLEIRMVHRLGHAFVHDIRIGHRPLAVRFGLDAYVDGRGVMKVGPSLEAGPALDQGALVTMWAEAVGFPWAWDSRDDVRWQAVDDVTAVLVVPRPESDLPITFRFDPRTGCPAACEAERYKGAAGPKIAWRGLFGGWRRFEGGVLAPGRFLAHWSDEARPWIDIRTHSVRLGVPVEEALELGRRALAAGTARRPSGPVAATGPTGRRGP